MIPRADIAKCSGTGCTRRDSCIRFLAPAAKDRQWWIHPQTDDCPNYASAAEYEKLYQTGEGS